MSARLIEGSQQLKSEHGGTNVYRERINKIIANDIVLNACKTITGKHDGRAKFDDLVHWNKDGYDVHKKSFSTTMPKKQEIFVDHSSSHHFKAFIPEQGSAFCGLQSWYPFLILVSLDFGS